MKEPDVMKMLMAPSGLYLYLADLSLKWNFIKKPSEVSFSRIHIRDRQIKITHGLYVPQGIRIIANLPAVSG